MLARAIAFLIFVSRHGYAAQYRRLLLVMSRVSLSIFTLIRLHDQTMRVV